LDDVITQAVSSSGEPYGPMLLSFVSLGIACIVNHLTRDKDIDAVVPEVLDAASEIMSEYE
jgi:hypothetical protein